MNDARLAELFGGAERYKALRCLFEHPDRAFGPRELAAEADIDPGNASRWLRRWADLGLLDKSSIHRQFKYSPAKDASLEPLLHLFQQDSELVKQLRETTVSLGDKVAAAAIFGSVARGSDTGSSDVDVLLVTSLTRLSAQRTFQPVSRSIGRAVNVLSYSPDEWSKALNERHPLAVELLSNPLILLKGKIDAIA